MCPVHMMIFEPMQVLDFLEHWRYLSGISEREDTVSQGVIWCLAGAGVKPPPIKTVNRCLLSPI